MLVVGAIKAVATYVQAYLMGVFGQRIIADIQNSITTRKRAITQLPSVRASCMAALLT